MTSFYKKIYGFSVAENQPLLLLKKSSNRSANGGRYYPAELCFLSGVTDEMASDNKLMSNIGKNTKLCPDQKVEEIDTILTLLNETKTKLSKENLELPSSSEKMKNYGIKILNTKENTFKGYTMKPPIMIGGEKGNTKTNNFSKFFFLSSLKIYRNKKLYKLNLKLLSNNTI